MQEQNFELQQKNMNLESLLAKEGEELQHALGELQALAHANDDVQRRLDAATHELGKQEDEFTLAHTENATGAGPASVTAVTRTPLSTVLFLAMGAAPSTDLASLLPLVLVSSYTAVWAARLSGAPAFFEYPASEAEAGATLPSPPVS